VRRQRMREAHVVRVLCSWHVAMADVPEAAPMPEDVERACVAAVIGGLEPPELREHLRSAGREVLALYA
jgi:hypothetical protein